MSGLARVADEDGRYVFAVALRCNGLILPAALRQDGKDAMPKTIAVLGSALFFVVAPLVLAGFVPWWITHWEFRPPFSGIELTRAIGLMLIIAGVPGVVDSFARFALEGWGRPPRSRRHKSL